MKTKAERRPLLNNGIALGIEVYSDRQHRKDKIGIGQVCFALKRCHDLNSRRGQQAFAA